MGVFKTQPSEIYNLDAEDIKFFDGLLDLYIEAQRKSVKGK